ncbi:MAG: radical SAM protein, partial [Candidatus Nitrotoga sp.]
SDHSRDSAGLRYVYPVISRRAGGVSVGINLNPNNACNWRCIYCQVPNLTRGAAPPIDLVVLEQELKSFLHELIHGDFMTQRVPLEARRINDIALSGNGEPTSAAEFVQVIELVARLKRDLALPAHIKIVLITNGSLLHQKNVQQGVRLMAKHNGEVWFKLDRASQARMLLVNSTVSSMEKVKKNVLHAISLCPTWLQTCWFALDGQPPSKQDEEDYLNFLREVQNESAGNDIVPLWDDAKLKGVLLYSLARPSLQAEAPRLSALSEQQLEVFAMRIRKLGAVVQVA